MSSTRSFLAAAAITYLAAAPPLAAAQPTFNELHRFSAPLQAGRAPLVEGPAGVLFGVAASGGPRDMGVVFKLTPDGSGSFTFSILYQFTGPDGREPNSLIYSAADGLLYGTTRAGGMSGGVFDDQGTVFSLTTTGTLTTLADFDFDLSFTSGMPLQPVGLVEGSDGNFYGTSSAASAIPGRGSVFKMTRSGVVQPLHLFDGSNGADPSSVLVEGSDGFLYGTTHFGGTDDAGTVYKIAKTGSGFTTLHHFAGAASTMQPRTLVLDSSGGSDLFYGLTAGGGANQRGSVFTITPAGAYSEIAGFGSFSSGDPAFPTGPLVKGPDGLFYGTSESGGPGMLGTIFSVSAGGTIAVVHDFASNPSPGLITRAGLMLATDGLLYGTTVASGVHNTGTAFRVDTAAPFDQVQRVADVPSLGPAIPRDRMIRASDGHLYGTTFVGGEFNRGAVIRLANGVVTTLYSFNYVDGMSPSGELVQGSDGHLYGTTQFGGDPTLGVTPAGTVFRLTLSGTFTLLHTFTGSDGVYPIAGLVEGPDGNFYGTTSQGGSGLVGTVFKITPAGALTTLHEFSGPDGWFPWTGSLVIGEDGFFYGVTREGGTVPTNGVAYKIDSDGNFVLLHEFANPDGVHPIGLTLGTDGNLYGTAEFGGDFSGTLFRMTPAGAVTVLHAFDRDVDGWVLAAPPTEAGDGMIYGSASGGGDLPGFVQGVGTLYQYGPGGLTVLHTFTGFLDDGATPLAGLVQGTDNRLYGSTSDTGGTLFAIGVGITNKAPRAANQTIATPHDTPTGVTLTGADPDGNMLTFLVVDDPDHGVLSGTAPNLIYTPNGGYSGPDAFRFRVNDGTVSSNVGTVLIDVTGGGGNTPPVAVDDAYAVNEDDVLNVAAPGVLGNDTDADGNPLTAILVAGPAHGVLALNSDGSFTYTPGSNYNGPDSFTYKANDGTADSNVATVSITVNAVNDAPVAVDESYTTNQDVVLNVPAPGILGNDTDVDGNPLTAVLVTGPTRGFVILFANGRFTYTPAGGYVGPDSFTYKANDGTADSNVATVSIDVQNLAIATTTVLQASATTVGLLQPVTLTATVAPVPPAIGVPVGSVEFLNGTTVLGTAPLTAGSASLTTNGLPVGANSLTARYVGAGLFVGSVSPAVTVTVQAPAASSFAVAFPLTNPQLFGTPVSVAAIVFPLAGSVSPTGTVEFYEGMTLMATGTLSGGVATASWTPGPGSGVRLTWVRYLGDASFAPSTSAPALFTLYVGTAPATTTTTLTAAPSPSTLGQTITFTATIGNAVPVGSVVAFFADGTLLGTAPVAIVGGARQAVLTTSSLPVGAHVVSASYVSAPGFAASNSNLLLQVVNP